MAFTQVVQLSTTNTAVTNNFYLGNAWVVNRESPFNANARRNLSDGVSSANAGTLLLNDNTLENLNSFVGTLNNPDVDTNSVTSTESWDVVA